MHTITQGFGAGIFAGSRSCRCLLATLLMGSALTSGTLHAQIAASADSDNRDIIVTARKRAETLQNVPATIGVVSQQTLANTGASNLEQLAEVAPGLNIGKAPTGNEIGVTLRGLGSSPGVPSFDSSVSLFVDGVYAPRSREFAASMFDIQRIEVIRGTQAALLGKNTSLGAINLITRKPGDTLAIDARGSYEFERGSTLFSGGIDIPITATLKARLSGQYSDDNGYVHNTITNQYAPRIRDRAGRAVIVWTPGPVFDATAVVQHDIAKNFGSPIEFIATTGLPQTLAALAGYPGVVESNLDRSNALTTPRAGGEQTERLLVDKYSLTGNFHAGDHTITSITGYSRYTDNNMADADGLPSDYLGRNVAELGTQFSQEVRLVSPTDKPFDYLVGALYIDGLLRNSTLFAANFPFGPASGVNIAGSQLTYFQQHNDAESAFAQVNYKVSPKFRLTGGLRWTREKKSVDLSRTIVVPGLFSTAIFPPYAPFSLGRVEKNLDYSVGAQYQVNPDALVYVSYGKGTKGGGYAQSVTLLNNAEYNKEVARTAEIGVKLQDPNRKWVFNLSAFNTNVDGFQLVTFTGIQFLVGNTDLRSRGVEVEAHWYPVRGLHLFINNTYADAQDRHTHNPIPLAPKWSGSGGFGYHTALSGALDFKADGSVDYRSKRYYQQDPATSPPGGAFTTYNLGLAVGPHNDKWEIRLIGRNLTNANAASFVFPAPLLPAGNQAATSERGRTVALQISLKE